MTLIRCTRCGRALKHASPNGLGPKCSIVVLGAKPKRPRLFEVRSRKQPDARQAQLFAEVRP